MATSNVSEEQEIVVRLAVKLLEAMPRDRLNEWISSAIAEKLDREVWLKENSAEARALQRIANPIREEDWVTIGSLDEEFDMEEIAKKVRERGYRRKVSNTGASISN